VRLIDCFIESLAYTLEVVKDADSGQQREFDSVQGHICSLLDSLQNTVPDGGYSQQQYQLALFAVVAFIDEQIVSSQWEHRQLWSRSLLQRRLFDTSNAGVDFFEKLDGLNPFNPAERDIREVYFYCISLGFSGKFYGEGVQSSLQKIKKDNFQLLLDGDEAAENALFPAAFGRVKSEGKVSVARDYTPLFYGGPIVALLISFFYFKKELMDLANFLVISV